MRRLALALIPGLLLGCDRKSQTVAPVPGERVDSGGSLATTGPASERRVPEPARADPQEPGARGIDVAFAAQARPEFLRPRLHGRVVDENGLGLPGVTLQPYSGIATRFACEKVVTDAGGNFVVSTAKCGTPMWSFETDARRVIVGITFQDTTYACVDGLSWWDVEITNEPGIVHPREFVMAPGGTIEGKLVDAATGEPLALGLRLYTGEARATRFFRYAESDARGEFREQGLAPGEYTIDANGADGLYPVLGHCTVRAQESARVELRLERPRAE